MFDHADPVPGAGTTAIAPPPRPLESLEAELCTLAGHLAAATCRFLVLLAEFDARQGWASWDMPSCSAWLSWKCQLSASTAREQVRVARALCVLPVIRGEFAAGRFSYAKVRALTRIADTESEAALAEMAGPMTAGQLDRFARAHRTVTRDMDDRARLARRLTWRLEEDGSLSLSARLPPEDGAAVLAALRAAVDGPGGAAVEDAAKGEGASAEARSAADDLRRPTSSSLADALVEIAGAYLSGRTRDAQNPDVYQVVIHATPDVLAPAARPAPQAAAPDAAAPVVSAAPVVPPLLAPGVISRTARRSARRHCSGSPATRCCPGSATTTVATR